uniref:Uncharacterized protein n=1 Tax=Cannabis sativa TaxID=3483 RepID=A0A803QCC1_CANSA
MRGGENTRYNNDQEGKIRSMGGTRSASRHGQSNLQERLNQKKIDLRQQLGPKQGDSIHLRVDELENKFKKHRVRELGKQSGCDFVEEFESEAYWSKRKDDCKRSSKDKK